jgi:hypothetical protein
MSGAAVTDESVRAFYRSGEYRSKRQMPDERAHQERRAAHVIQHIPGQPCVHVDIGCSKGMLMQAVRSRFSCASYGVDLDPVLTNGVIHPTIEDVPEAPDLVTMIHSLEHMVHPARELRRVWKRMSEGVLIVEVPNGDLDHPLGHCYSGGFRWPHVSMFDIPSLSWTLARSGFSVERIWLHGEGGLERAPAYYYLMAIARRRDG